MSDMWAWTDGSTLSGGLGEGGICGPNGHGYDDEDWEPIEGVGWVRDGRSMVCPRTGKYNLSAMYIFLYDDQDVGPKSPMVVQIHVEGKGVVAETVMSIHTHPDHFDEDGNWVWGRPDVSTSASDICIKVGKKVWATGTTGNAGAFPCYAELYSQNGPYDFYVRDDSLARSDDARCPSNNPDRLTGDGYVAGHYDTVFDGSDEASVAPVAHQYGYWERFSPFQGGPPDPSSNESRWNMARDTYIGADQSGSYWELYNEGGLLFGPYDPNYSYDIGYIFGQLQIPFTSSGSGESTSGSMNITVYAWAGGHWPGGPFEVRVYDSAGPMTGSQMDAATPLSVEVGIPLWNGTWWGQYIDIGLDGPITSGLLIAMGAQERLWDELPDTQYYYVGHWNTTDWPAGNGINWLKGPGTVDVTANWYHQVWVDPVYPSGDLDPYEPPTGGDGDGGGEGWIDERSVPR